MITLRETRLFQKVGFLTSLGTLRIPLHELPLLTSDPVTMVLEIQLVYLLHQTQVGLNLEDFPFDRYH
jgi:hypothetical protein